MTNREPPPLNAELNEIIGAARGAHEPSELSRARVRRRVELKLAAGLGLVLAPASTAFAGAAKVTLIVAALGTVVGTGIYVLPRHTPAPAAAPARTHARAVAKEIAAPPRPDERPAPIDSPSPSPAPAPRRRPHAPAPAPVDNVSALADETRILGSANAALARRDVAGALALLEDYDRRGGAAILGEERTVTGILALCASGRADAARAEARHFRARWPKSPLAARVDGSCVGAARPARTPTP